MAALPNDADAPADADVGREAQREAAADRRSVHGGDDRLGQRPDRLRKRCHRLLEAEPVDGRVVGVEHARPEVAQVDPGAEAAPGAGQHDGADGAVVARSATHAAVQLAEQLLVDGVQPLGTVEPEQRDAVVGVLDGERGHRAHTRSMIVAVPMPPPVHIVTRPVVRSRRSSSSRSVPISMAPVAPIGWPSAIAPPLTLTRSGSRPRSRIVFSGTAANASLISQRSMSPICHRPPSPGSAPRPDPVRSA